MVVPGAAPPRLIELKVSTPEPEAVDFTNVPGVSPPHVNVNVKGVQLVVFTVSVCTQAGRTTPTSSVEGGLDNWINGQRLLVLLNSGVNEKQNVSIVTARKNFIVVFMGFSLIGLYNQT
jgi:hypothetical protein